MPLELDHVFVCASDAPLARQALADFGLQFGAHHVHKGQGTASVAACFDNAYLELIEQHDDAELRSDVVSSVNLWERVHWHDTGACPIGLALRTTGAPAPPCEFETWPYPAPFLPVGAAIPVVTERGAFREPLLFISTHSRAPLLWPEASRPPLEHRGRRRMVTGLRLSLPDAEVMPRGLLIARDLGLVELIRSERHHLDVEWDGGREGKRHDFHPIIPLSIRW